MRLGITWKLFAAIFACSIIVVVVMAMALRLSFQWGFLDYINRAEAARIESLTAALADGYEENAGWNFLRHDNRLWWRLVMASGRPPADELRPPPPDPGPGAHVPPAPPPQFLPLGRRVTLLDAARRPVAGNPHLSPDAALQPIEVAGQTVGWLAVVPFKALTRDIDLHFAAQQRRAALFIALVAIVLAAVVAVLLARHLLRPVRRLAQGTRALAAGEFATRIPMSSNDELGQLANDFNLLAHTLERNEKARRDFLADVSHELRTPLSVLRGELEAIEDGVRQLTPAAFASLQSEVRTLSKVIDDLHELALSDIGALNYRKTYVDVVALLDAAVEGFRDRLAAQRIQLEVDRGAEIPLRAFADPGRLIQLFNNVIENSVRYTDPGGRLRISCAADPDVVRIDFQDSAPGVPEDLLPQVFERLFRVERSRSRAHGGAGLGLAICRNIIEAHGGSIDAHPSPLGGVWIAVRLPRNQGGAAEAPAEPA